MLLGTNASADGEAQPLLDGGNINLENREVHAACFLGHTAAASSLLRGLEYV